jgi:ribonuclease G
MREFVSADTDEILIDDPALLARAKKWLETYFPTKAACAIHYSEKETLFTRYLVEDELENIMSDRLYLNSGAWITIEQTEALTAIDVNMGGAQFSIDRAKQIFSLNREAMREIFRQLRLRSIGGIIVIDFVDMTDKGDIKSLQNFADELMVNDPAPLQRGNISSFGLMEVTRSSRGASLHELLVSRVQKRKNISTVCLEILRREEQEASRKPGIPRIVKVTEEQKKWFDLRSELLEHFTARTGSILKLEL